MLLLWLHFRGALWAPSSMVRQARAFAAACAVLMTLFVSLAAAARDVPPLTGRVNDGAALLSAAERQRIEQKLALFESQSGHQFAVLTIDTLGEDSLEEYSLRVVEAWQLGKKKQDDGLLLLIVRDDRKARIEVGYGLEGDIPDAVASRVIRDILSPAFRQRRYGAGIEASLDALIRAAGGDPGAGVPAVERQPAKRKPGFPLPLLVMGLFLLAPVFMALLNRGGGRGGAFRGGVWPGGGFGGGLGGFGGGGFGGGGRGGGGGGFSGGGGGFGGGGASGEW